MLTYEIDMDCLFVKNGEKQVFAPAFGSVEKLLEHHAEKFGDKDALVGVDLDRGEERNLSYKELSRVAYKAANFLHQRGIRQGDRIAFALQNTSSVLILELAAGLLGASSLPLDIKRDTKERKLFKLKDGSAKLLFARADEEGMGKEMEFIKKTLPSLDVAVFEGEEDFAKLVEDQPEEPAFSPSGSLEKEYVLLYTSGTTAHPKGVPLTLRACFANAEGIANWQQLSPDDRFLIVLPLHHVNSTIMSLAAILTGGTIILASRYSASKFWEVASAQRATITSVVPTILHDLLARKDEYFSKPRDISSLRRILIGSAPVLPDETLRFMDTFQVDVVQGYGQTETALRVTGVPINLPRETYLEMTKNNSIGKELAYCNVTILKEDGTEAAENEEGEICIRGPVLGEGYWNNPEETAKEFRGGWFHSGDLGSYKTVNGEKYFFIKGRIKEIIIKGGVNISPAAVEDGLLKNFPEIDEVCAVGYPDSRMGEEIAALVSFRPEISGHRKKEILEAMTSQASGETLSSYETPSKVFEAEEEIPKTSTGKIQRMRVKHMVRERLKEEKAWHYHCRLISDNEEEALARAVEINNKRWSVPSDIAEFRERAKNGHLLGVFDEQGILQGTLSALQITGENLDRAFSWDKVTGSGTLKTNDPKGDILLCVSISVDSRGSAELALPEIPSFLGQALIEEYLKTNLDNVIRFHRKPKGGLPQGGEVTRILPEARPEDAEALGYNVLVEYPDISKNAGIIKSKNAPASVLLIEQAMALAKEKGCRKVVAFSRPAQFRLHVAKALDDSLPFEPHDAYGFSQFAKVVHRYAG